MLSKRLQFIRVDSSGNAAFAGWAPHLDLEPLDPSDLPRLKDLLGASWLQSNLEQRALALAAGSLVPTHFEEVAGRRVAQVDKTLAAVHERLQREIDFWSDRWVRLKEDQDAGKDVRLNLENARRTISDLEGRLENRKKELKAMRHVVNGTPVVMGAGLIVPMGLLRRLKGESSESSSPDTFPITAAAREKIERLAMATVTLSEERTGCRVVDVSGLKCGWDLTSYPPPQNGRDQTARHIEVKGRVKGATTITVTRNEIMYALNQAEKFVLAIVLVGDNDAVEGPYYITNPFDAEPGWGVSSINYDLQELLTRGEK